MLAQGRLTKYLWPSALTALAYAVAGQLALWLAAPPAYAAPLYPAAGIALAAVLTYGRRALPGVFLGALVVNGLLISPRGLVNLPAVLSVLAICSGAAAQAALGSRLVQARVAPPRDLSEPRDALALFALGGAVACLLNASVATLSLWLSGALPASAMSSTALSWWSGDALGVLVATPIVLTLIGQPRASWAPRRLTVGLPMLVVVAVLALATAMVARSDEQRSLGVFDRDASRTADALDAGLLGPMNALEALRGLYLASDEVTEAEFRAATEAWLSQYPSLAAVGYGARVERDSVAKFVQTMNGSRGGSYHVFDRADSPAGMTLADRDVVAIARIEPAGPNARALGVNSLSVPAARQAIERAAAGDAPSATAAFTLTQAPDHALGLVVYRAIQRGATPVLPAARRTTMTGVVFVTLRIEDAARTLLSKTPAYLRWCLMETEPAGGAGNRVGGEGCAPIANGELGYERAISFADRQWQLVLHARKEDLPVEGRWNLWLFAVTGLLSTALLGALLLTITGRAQRIETAVTERTADLRREVQERRRAEQALRESEQRWRNIIDHIPIGVVYADMDGHIRETNPRLCEMLGLDAQTLTQRSLADITFPDDQRGDADSLRALTAGESSLLRRRVRLVRGDGSLIWVQTGLSVLRDAKGLPVRLAGVVEDITEHLQLADAERARESAEAASRAKSEFLSRMSHELRTPLNAILGFSQLLTLDREPTLSARQHEWTDQVQRAGWHLLNLINEMLDLSRIEAGQLRLELGPVQPAPLLQDCLAMIEPAAKARKVVMEPLAEGPAVAVRADPTRLKQVLTNLLSNAVKYNRKGGSVRCTLVATETTVQIRVADQGDGLSPEQLAGLFEPFNRLGHEQGGVEGTGLGLVISRRLAEAMGGSLEATSGASQGSVFTLTLPAIALPAAQPVHEPGQPTGQDPTYRERRIHYIEDNETNAEVMRGILSRRPQVRLSISGTGEAGLADIAADLPDLILLDMHLPDLDGLDVLRRLADDEQTASIPVLVVSADATASRIEQAFALGAADYATKPVDVPSFLAQVDALLERRNTRFN